MKDELFEELMASVRQGGAILRGEMPPSRTFPGVECPAESHRANDETAMRIRSGDDDRA